MEEATLLQGVGSPEVVLQAEHQTRGRSGLSFTTLGGG